MIPYRFLPPAEVEMTEASLFYEAATPGLGTNFLDDVQQGIDSLREYPNQGTCNRTQFKKDPSTQISVSV